MRRSLIQCTAPLGDGGKAQQCRAIVRLLGQDAVKMNLGLARIV